MGSKDPLVNSTATSLDFPGGPLPLGPLPLSPLGGGECVEFLGHLSSWGSYSMGKRPVGTLQRCSSCTYLGRCYPDAPTTHPMAGAIVDSSLLTSTTESRCALHGPGKFL